MRAILAPLALLILLAVPATAAADKRQITIFEAPRELLRSDAPTRERTLDEMRALGATWLRVVLYWRDVAPDPRARRKPGSLSERDPADYAWGPYDATIAAARARGLRVMLTLSGPVPKWATRSRRSYVTRPSPRRFARFVEAAGRHYARAVSAWSVWNEPNHPDFLRPQYVGRGSRKRPYSPRWYRKLVWAADRGLRRSGNGRDRLLIGETAPRGTGKVVAPLTFLRGSMCLSSSYRKRRKCNRLPADAYAHHAYTTRSGPWFRPRGRNDVTIGVLRRLNRALYRAGRARAARRGMRIWLTEFGIQSRPDPYVGVSETRQAEYRSIAERMAYYNRRVQAFSQYLMRDDLPRRGPRHARYGGFESGLRHSDGNRKRAYEGFRLPLVALRQSRRRDRFWGLVRPARGRTRVTIEMRRRGWERWHRLKSDRTNSRGYWHSLTRHRRGMRYRVRWTAPDGTKHVGPPTRVYRRR